MPLRNPLALLVVQAQPGSALTLKLAAPPAEPGLALLGESATAQPLACVTVCGCPLNVMSAARVGPVLAATLKLTVPLPVPLAVRPLIQLALSEALQVQPAAVVTLKLALPPAALALLDVGDIT